MKTILFIFSLLVSTTALANTTWSFESAKREAERGNAEAQNVLGMMYLGGQVTEIDEEKAAHWFTQAALQGNAEGIFNIAQVYEFGVGVEINLDWAVDWYGRSAAKGYLPAIVKLGDLHHDGKGVQRNLLKAVEYYQHAVNEGHPDGEYKLGMTLINAGMADNGQYHLIQAALKGHEGAKRALGLH